MNRAIVAGLVVVAAGAAGACRGRVQPKNEEEKTIYAMGAVLGKQAQPLKLSPLELDVLKQGVADAASGDKLLVEPTAYRARFQDLISKRTAGDVPQEKLRGVAYQTQAALEKGAVKTDSGLIYRTLTPGNGPSPGKSDVVKANYKGTLVGGKVFDSSYDRGQPLEFSLDGVIPCWTEGIQRMKVGEKAQFVCPFEIAYGDNGAPPAIPGGATLIFEVELLGFTPKKK